MNQLRRLLLLLLVLMFPGAYAADQPLNYRDDPALPAGQIGMHITSLIAAANANDGAAVQAFIEQHAASSFQRAVPMIEHQRAFLGAYASTGGVDFRAIRHFTPARMTTTVIVQDRVFGKLYEVNLSFDADPQVRINNLKISPANPVPGPAVTEREAVAEIRAMMGSACDKGVFSGSVLVAHGDKVLFETACGEASKRYHVANNLDTRFNLGSMNKMFTAVAIAQLVEQGKLSYEDPIGKYIDESWLPKSITDKVTIAHLLSHTSGLGSYFNETFMKSSRTLYRNVADYKPLVRGETLAFEPGKRFSYSNTGLFLLGVVIEKVTGQDYFDVIRERVYKLAGMRDSDSYAMDDPVPNLAMGYLADKAHVGKWRENTFEHVYRGGPAGGGFSTVRDLNRFAMALRSGLLVKKETLQTLWTDKAAANYGYGFHVAARAAGKVVGHSGGFPGISSNLDIYVDKGYTVAVMSNYGGGSDTVKGTIRGLIDRVAGH